MTASPRGRPQIVALDLGGVILDVNKTALGKLLNRPQQAIEQAFFEGGHHRALARGDIRPRDFIARAATLLRVTRADAHRAWCGMIQVTPAGRALVHRLVSAGHTIHLWSNIDPMHLDLALEGLGDCSRTHLRVQTTSCHVGAWKPDDPFWEFVIACGTPALYLDDRADCVHAAVQRGIRAALVQGPHEAHTACEAAGLL